MPGAIQRIVIVEAGQHLEGWQSNRFGEIIVGIACKVCGKYNRTYGRSTKIIILRKWKRSNIIAHEINKQKLQKQRP